MKDDLVESLERLGHSVVLLMERPSDFDRDERFEEKLSSLIKEGADLVFSMNYLPVTARVCKDLDTPYISWISDCPNNTLFSKTVTYPTNRIFCFDSALLATLKARGANAFFCPLGVNIAHIENVLKKAALPSYEVSFLGSFYQNNFDQLSKVEGMPEQLRGFIDGVVEAQLPVYGMDMVSSLFSDEKAKELFPFVPINLGDDYTNCAYDMFRDWIRKRVTIEERRRLLKRIGESFALCVWSEAAPPETVKCDFKGYANYRNEMPAVFAGSKVNLNFTLRSITSGIPLRVTDVLGAGGFLLTNYQPDMAMFFTNMKELVWFESEEDLIEKTGYFLAHDDERKKIAAAGKAAAENYFSYDVLLPEILKQAL